MKRKIKNWDKFQHFRDRRPPWIKLYKDILDDPDWHELSGDEAKALIMLWLIASEDEEKKGSIPDDRVLSFRMRIEEKKLKQILVKLKKWIFQDDISLISLGCQADDAENVEECIAEKEKAKRGSRMKEEKMPVEWKEFCEKNRADLDPQEVFNSFRDYWLSAPGKSGIKLDWFATWRNWVRNQRSFNKSSETDRDNEVKRILGI